MFDRRQPIADSRRNHAGLVRLSAVGCQLALSTLLAFSLFAQEDAPPPPPAPPSDSALVAAAKRAKEGHLAIPHKVITNADVKKAKGKLIELPSKGGPVPFHVLDQKSSLEKHDDALKAAAAAERQANAAQKKISDLEKELAAIEQSYYDENDPTYRDDVIRKKFEEKQRELEGARAALSKP